MAASPRTSLSALAGAILALAIAIAFAFNPSPAEAELLADDDTSAADTLPSGPVLTPSVAGAVAPPLAASLPDIAADARAPAEEILQVFGWSLQGLPEAITHRLSAPPLADARPTWAPAPRLVEDAPPPPPSTASAVVVLDEASMAVLAQREPHTRLAPASLTKVATAAVAVQSGQLDETVHNTVESWAMPGSSLMGLHPGDQFSLRDLVYGLMLPSGNDAALSIGRHLAGDDGVFVHHMNQMARLLGLTDTHFTDAHGLGGPHHYSSAYDLAVLSRYAMQFQEFRLVAGAQDWTASGSRAISMASYVGPFMTWVEGADGVKTGFTRAAGPTFIGSASRDGNRLYVVVLNSQDRFGEAAAMLEWAFQHHVWPGGQTVADAPAPAEEDDGVVQAARLEE